MAGHEWLPVKVVLPSDGDTRDWKQSSRPFDPLCEVDQAYRDNLTQEVEKVRNAFSQSLADGIPGVAKISLKKDALIKTRRPSEVFNDNTCPIIGIDGSGVLLASVTGDGLGKLERTIADGSSKSVVSHLSTLDAIAPYSQSDALLLPSDKAQVKPSALRVKLFRHKSAALNAKLDAAFERYARGAGVTEIKAVDYGRGVKIYRCGAAQPEVAANLARFIGTQSVCQMPMFHPVRTTSRALCPATPTHFSLPDPLRDYPVVGMFDSGTDPNNSMLQAWVVARVDKYFDQSIQDNSHGSFVGGLLANGKQLNFDDSRFPSTSVKFVDVVVFNRTGQVEESDLVWMIRESLEAFPEVKVWNLSLASDSYTCSDNEVSEFGSAMDELQRRFNVLFVCASGNLNSLPLRQWPVQPGFESDDRVAPPADSFRGLTVGGVAHLENERTFVASDEVSPFSRRGPGVGGVPKPELAHCAGNCDGDGNYMQTGVVSIDGKGNLAEDIGVSFATPLVTALAGAVGHELDTETDPVSPQLIKGMMVHSAFVANGPIDPALFEYVGCGRPPDIDSILKCYRTSATVVFKADAERRSQFIKRTFPIPPCLFKTGHLVGEMFMTVLYDPPMDRDYKMQYCRRDVEASLGTLKFNPKTGKLDYTRQLDPSPKGLRDRYSREMADFGLSWSPLKMYYKKFKARPRAESLAGLEWRLTLPVQNRAECDDESALPVTVILTIRSDDDEDDVYTELIQGMEAEAWRVSDLAIRSRPREEERA